MTTADSSFAGREYLVAGAARAGLSMAEALVRRGARVTIADARPGADLGALAVTAVLGADDIRELIASPLARFRACYTSPGWWRDAPLLVACQQAGVPVTGELDLAWELRGPDAADWLAISGTNGKTTTTQMVSAIEQSVGRSCPPVGNIGSSVVGYIDAGTELLAVEMSSFQLARATAMHPAVGALLNIADDHLDWHGSRDDYISAKSKVLDAEVALGNADDPVVAGLLAAAPAETRISFTLGEPAAGQLGLVDGVLTDRAFGADRPILPAASLKTRGAHNIANALAAAAITLATGITPAQVGAALAAFHPGDHRNVAVATVAGVEYIDDSKATNAHAAAASMSAYRSLVWVAGGDAKGVDLSPLVAAHAGSLRAAVLIGACRNELAEAIAVAAPAIPVIVIDDTSRAAITAAVNEAAVLARPGDTVLLAPAASSIDMFTDYAERGEMFAAAVHRLEDQ